MDTVDFADPKRPKTCLEVDFPILPVNQVAIGEGNAGKPIYQMSKWWARRRSSVFRAMLIAAATKAPEDPSLAAKTVWDTYYANHQKKGAFAHLKVADIFMGGGTTLVEGSRLGMQLSGTDLNPIASFVVTQEFADVNLDEVRQFLAEIEEEVKPQIIPFYYCDEPNGQKGTWTHVPTGRVENITFDPLALTPEQRRDYRYIGPETIYTFWSKHGPCQVTGCGHRTPIMSSPVMAVKTLTVKYWPHVCGNCGHAFDIEHACARMAPSVPLFVAPGEQPYAVLDSRGRIHCPTCDSIEVIKLDKAKSKKVMLSLLVHPNWLQGAPRLSARGQAFGGSVTDDVDATVRWNETCASQSQLLEVRGTLPDTVTCPDTGIAFRSGSDGGTTPKPANFKCAGCGFIQPIVDAVESTRKTAPVSIYAIQAFSQKLKDAGSPYNGRFFAPATDARAINAAYEEWERRKNDDLSGYWPRSEIPFGHMTHQRQPLPRHGYVNWVDMFNARQLLVHTQMLKAITTVGSHSWGIRDFVLGAWQQYLRNQNMFCFWDLGYDKLVPFMSNSNYHPKNNVVENCVFSDLGRGNWTSCADAILEGREWAENPWEPVSVDALESTHPALSAKVSGGSEKVFPHDHVGQATIAVGSSTELNEYVDSSIDLVITDPPFGGLVHYSELSDFFYVWLRLVLGRRYPEAFGPEYTPKALEAVSNKAREPEDPAGFYQRLLTACWKEAHRILKPGGTLAFTFHHSEDDPWVSVLEALFDAGFFLEATFPIRSDETKGEGEFGSKKIEYDIIHVCRKRIEQPKAVSWARMRREVLGDVRQLQTLLENHARAGLPVADLQVIRRGKALEYFSRHYGNVYVDEGRTISVKDALVGINQLIDEDASGVNEPPPVAAEPITRQFLRMFDGKSDLPRDQIQKLLRGSGITPEEFTTRGWAVEKKKVFHLVDPVEFARNWQGRHKRRLISDFDQALVLIGACYDGSGINAADTLKNGNFRPHAALRGLLEWLGTRAPQPMRNGAIRALQIYQTWAASNKDAVAQMRLFEADGT